MFIADPADKFPSQGAFPVINHVTVHLPFSPTGCGQAQKSSRQTGSSRPVCGTHLGLQQLHSPSVLILFAFPSHP